MTESYRTVRFPSFYRAGEIAQSEFPSFSLSTRPSRLLLPLSLRVLS